MKAVEIAMASAQDEQHDQHDDELDGALASATTECDEDHGQHLSSGQSPGGSKTDGEDFFRNQADALVRVAQDFLVGGDGDGRSGKTKTTSTADHYQIIVHVVNRLCLLKKGKNRGRVICRLNRFDALPVTPVLFPSSKMGRAIR